MKKKLPLKEIVSAITLIKDINRVRMEKWDLSELEKICGCWITPRMIQHFRFTGLNPTDFYFSKWNIIGTADYVAEEYLQEIEKGGKKRESKIVH